jgi:4-amino-4-deoxy-L-arabinose transferase-like glycosyltransferase
MVVSMPSDSRAAASPQAVLCVAGAAILAASLMAAIDLGRRILATNDEARFALLAQDMLSRGAWLFPRLNGAVYSAKPPLLAWLIALASWPGGRVTQLTAVLPSAAAAVATALILLAIGRSMLGLRAACFAALALITTQGWFLHARLPMPDMLMTLFITAAVAILWPMTRGRPGPWWVAFYVAMAAAFWAKGAAALLALAVAILWTIVDRRAGRWRALHLPAGLLLFAVLIAPWLIGTVLLDSAEMRELVVSDNVLWYLPRSPAILAGPPQHLFGILFPWVLVAPLAIWQAARVIRERGPDREPLLFLLVWAGAMLACLAISEQQRLRYYLPLISPVALLVGWWAALEGSDERTGVPWRVYGALAVVLGIATAAATVVRPSWSNHTHVAFPGSTLEVLVMTAGLVLMIAALVHGARRRRMRQAFVVAWLGTAVWVAGWYHWELDRRNAAYDYPRVRAEAGRLLPDAPVVAAWGVYELPFSFYFGRPVQSVRTPGDLDRVMSAHPRSSAVLTRAALEQMDARRFLRVLPLDRLNFDPIVLVSYEPAAADRRP